MARTGTPLLKRTAAYPRIFGDFCASRMLASLAWSPEWFLIHPLQTISGNRNLRSYMSLQPLVKPSDVITNIYEIIMSYLDLSFI